ncbi:MAG: arsenate reductase ArsC [Hyphomicrobiaceae bacterium]|nr:arsenate reductase ArsC [Hyphomicrobiaceae bacterium]
MTDRVYNVLFLCTHNSARSVIGECIINALGKGRFRGYSAGSHPRGAVNPYALEMLERLNYDTSRLRSKSWDEFAAPGAPPLDFVFTVCDDAAGETCPHWPGQPMTAHWGLPDPSAVTGSEAEKRAAFTETHRMLHQRISIFVNLPIASLDRLTLQKRLDEMGSRGSAELPARG